MAIQAKRLNNGQAALPTSNAIKLIYTRTYYRSFSGPFNQPYVGSGLSQVIDFMCNQLAADTSPRHEKSAPRGAFNMSIWRGR